MITFRYHPPSSISADDHYLDKKSLQFPSNASWTAHPRTAESIVHGINNRHGETGHQLEA